MVLDKFVDSRLTKKFMAPPGLSYSKLPQTVNYPKLAHFDLRCTQATLQTRASCQHSILNVAAHVKSD